MRIIAGKFKAKKIISPKTEKTRPTLDRVKEALFSIITPYIENSRVLDLFSGTGNLAIEAISRGAKFAWINDIESLAISTIISNTQLTKCQNYVKITKKDYIKCLASLSKINEKFDIIFLDPPYDSKYGINTLDYISKNKCILGSNGIIIYETDKNFINNIKDISVLENFENLVCFDTRNYGNVILKLYKWRE